MFDYFTPEEQKKEIKRWLQEPPKVEVLCDFIMGFGALSINNVAKIGVGLGLMQ